MPQPSTKSAIIMQINPHSPASEAYRSLRFNIECSNSDREVQTTTVTSAGRGEGKTTTALNLAVSYAQIGERVILMDTDLRKPSIHLAFGGDNSVGLTNYLLKQNNSNEIIRETNTDGLSVITSGPIPPNPSELLASKQMNSLLTDLKMNYDLIVIDTPPVLMLTDAKMMAAKSDGVLLVIEHGKVKRNIAKKVKEDLLIAKSNLLGIVWNKIKNQGAESYTYQ